MKKHLEINAWNFDQILSNVGGAAILVSYEWTDGQLIARHSGSSSILIKVHKKCAEMN